MNKHSKQYLIDFSTEQKVWLKALIYEVIETNGQVSNNFKEKIIDHILNSTPIEIRTPNLEKINQESKLVLKSLKHISGVNALNEKEEISFNNDITILYGMNGTGKSGYFRILNEIVGGNQKKEILPNIYVDENSKINVDISYIKDDTEIKSINWKGDTRSLPLLNRCKVFDTSYLNGLLDTRSSDETLVQPLGLNLFKNLIEVVDDIKNSLIDSADKISLNKPNIKLDNFTESIKNYFSSDTIHVNIKNEIEKNYAFSDENAKKIETLNKEIQIINQVNIQDKINLFKAKKNELVSLKESISNTESTLESLEKKSIELLKKYRVANDLSQKAKQKFEILNNLPSIDSEEWKNFIHSGNEYRKQINEDDTCPYCRQPLSNDNSVLLLKTYGLYLKDSSEQELNKVTKNIEELDKDIDKTIVSITISENIKEFLTDKKLNDELILNKISSFENLIKIVKDKLLENLRKKDESLRLEIPNTIKLLEKIESYITTLNDQIAQYSEENESRKERLKSLTEEISLLLENKSISDQKESIKLWILETEKEKDIRKKSSKLKTRPISVLSKKAHDELLTESLKTNFENELNFLGYGNLQVKIESAGIRKGISSTKLVLYNNNTVKQILSEGEQKSVALALFLSEIKLQKNDYPIILDDPVNSLDHKVAGKFAERLLELDNQVVLFNHNRLFLDAFESAKNHHICKTVDTDCNNHNKGKHIKVYQVISQGKHSKGILKNYKGNLSKSHIREAKKLLNRKPFDDEIKVANLLRLAVECTIDEKIFNNQVPTRLSNKNSRINWESLKHLNNDDTIINKLYSIHSRVSGGEMHNGTERNENPIDVEEFNSMVSTVELILVS